MKPNEAKLYLKMSRLATLIKDGDMSEELKEKLLKDLYGIRDEYVEQTKSKSVFVLEEKYEDYTEFPGGQYDSKTTIFSDIDVAKAYMKAKVELEKEYYLERGYTEEELEENGWINEYDAQFKTDEYVSIYDLYAAEPKTLLNVREDIETMQVHADELRKENNPNKDIEER